MEKKKNSRERKKLVKLELLKFILRLGKLV
jgi:hypothetical protein